MQKLKMLFKEGQMYLSKADHLLYITLPVVNEPKLLRTIIENLHHASLRFMETLLRYERLYKRISVIKGDFDAEYLILKNRLSKKYGLTDDEVGSVRALKKLFENIKKSSVEFARRERYVVCSDNFHELDVLDVKDAKRYLNLTKSLMKKTSVVFSR